MASKLPVLWIAADKDGNLLRQGTVSSPRGTFSYYRANADKTWEEPNVEYLPARRCRDKCRFFEPGIAAACSYWGGAVKSDGSDFCSKWEEE